jgi:hypothetical protein
MQRTLAQDPPRAEHIELEERIWFAAPLRRDLRAMKTRPGATAVLGCVWQYFRLKPIFALFLRRWRLGRA